MLEKLETFPAKRTLFITTIVAFIAFILLNIVMYPYTADTAAAGAPSVVEFELTWRASRAQEILSIWGSGLGQEQFILNLIDFAYMPAYALFIGGAVLITVRKQSDGSLKRFGFVAAIMPLGAWACDAVENVNLLQIFVSNIAEISEINAITASVAATIKFTLLIIAIGVFAINCFTLLIRHVRERGSISNK